MVKSVVLVFALFLLAACGFEPMYGEQRGTPNPGVAAMAETRIALIPDRAGQELRNHLLDQMTPRGTAPKPRYELQVRLTERRDNLGISRDDSATYARLTLTANFTLRDIASGTAVYQNQARWTNGFTVVPSHFANLSNEGDARSRGLRELSDDITRQLGLYFAKPAG